MYHQVPLLVCVSFTWQTEDLPVGGALCCSLSKPYHQHWHKFLSQSYLENLHPVIVHVQHSVVLQAVRKITCPLGITHNKELYFTFTVRHKVTEDKDRPKDALPIGLNLRQTRVVTAYGVLRLVQYAVLKEGAIWFCWFCSLSGHDSYCDNSTLKFNKLSIRNGLV